MAGTVGGGGGQSARPITQSGLTAQQSRTLQGGPSFAHFEFGMTEALIAQLVLFMDGLAWSPLTQAAVEAAIPIAHRGATGVYMLGRRQADGSIRVIYVGQSSSTLYSRLTRHADMVRHRTGLPAGDVYFRAAAIVIFNSVDLEGGLIAAYRTKWDGTDVWSGWNGSGFGSNDTGGGRDGQAPSKFDVRFPIDIVLPLDPNAIAPLLAGDLTARQAITMLSGAVPYTVRVAKELNSHADLGLTVPRMTSTPSISAHHVCKHILRALGSPWLASVFRVRIVFTQGQVGLQTTIANPAAWPNFPINGSHATITP